MTWALEMGIPLLVLVADHLDVSPFSMARASGECAMRPVIFRDHAEMIGGLRAWLADEEVNIDEGDHRRRRMRDTFRRSLDDHRNVWRMMTSVERDRVAHDLAVPRTVIRDFLRDDLLFASMGVGTRAKLAESFGFIWPGKGNSNSASIFEAAVVEYRWSAAEAAITLVACRSDVLERGDEQRNSDPRVQVYGRDSMPTTLPSWKALRDRRFQP
jgi:hypothetical protein